MRTVISGREVAHLWNSQTQSQGRNSGESLHFLGDTLFSYREPIARIVKAKSGEIVALLRDETFSVTTSKHQSWARQAVSNRRRFTVPSIGRHLGAGMEEAPDHKANLAAYETKLDTLAVKASRARQNVAYYAATLESIRDEANAYAASFGLRKRFTVPTIEDVRKRAAAQAKRDEKARKAREKKEAAARAEFAKMHAEQADSWIAGNGIPQMGMNLAGLIREKLGIPSGFDAMTFDKTSGQVVTTQGARVPVDHVRRIAARIISKAEHCKETGERFERIGERVGAFTVDTIDADGSVYVGCHVFTLDEVRRIAGIVGMREEATV